MAYISLYRKYRPYKFEDVVGQKIVVEILKKSIINNKIGHAYIFSGPRGTGKTSIAKIFARSVNCLNSVDGEICGECNNCKVESSENIDIIEIDAASNNGVEEIREIRNNVKLSPSLMKYKVYIIDEVHMLSNSAFNALLKTLEEPPSHVIFILATTEVNKIPSTVLSRCQKFDFKKISIKEIIGRINYILDKEDKKLPEEIIDFIAKYSDGGLRDAINLLDQILSLNNENITMDDVYSLIGIYNEDKIFEFIEYLLNGNVDKTIEFINEYNENEKNYIYLCDKIIEIIKDLLIYNNSDASFADSYKKKLNKFTKINVDKIYEILEILLKLDNELKRTIDQKLLAEVYFLKITMIFNNYVQKNSKIKDNLEVEQKVDTEKNVNKSVKKEEKTTEIRDEIKDIRINNVFVDASKELKNEFVDKFDEINDYISNKDFTSVANLLLKSTPKVVSNKNVLFTFKKEIDSNLFNLNLEEVKKLLKKIYNKKYDVISVSEEEWKNIESDYIKNIKNGVKYIYIEEKERKKKSDSKLQSSVEDIFGSDYSNEE